MLVPPVGAAYYRLVFPSFVGVYLLVLYSARNWYTSQEKQPGYTLYSLLGQEYSFSCYYKQFDRYKDIKKPKRFVDLTHWNRTKALPQILSCNYDRFAIALSLIKLNPLPKNGHSQNAWINPWVPLDLLLCFPLLLWIIFDQ